MTTATASSSAGAANSTPNSETTGSHKNIIVCSDGTGNDGGRFSGTNVWRIRQAVAAKAENGTDQVVIYQDGVGTETFRPMSIVGVVFSYGITKDLETLYSRVIQIF